MTIWVFNGADDEKTRLLVANSVKAGTSRFGWSQENHDNLLVRGNWERGRLQLFLLDVIPEDWIVHINTPVWGKCIAAQIITGYDFDDGLQCDGWQDFKHFFEVDTATIVEFDRNDPNVVPSVNLRPRYRFHRIYDEIGFHQTINNLNGDNVVLEVGESSQEYHLRQSTEEYLPLIVKLIHEMHRGKNLESFLAKVFRKIPGVVDVQENGKRPGTDHGADLIVTTSTSIGHLQLENRVIVQVKSYEGRHYDLEVIEQVKTGINQYSGTAGMVITTAEKTKDLENAVQGVSNEIGYPVDLLAFDDVAKFVIKHAPELVFNLCNIS